jgi:hypothetical protein
LCVTHRTSYNVYCVQFFFDAVCFLLHIACCMLHIICMLLVIVVYCLVFGVCYSLFVENDLFLLVC